jgi:biotin operon repressor
VATLGTIGTIKMTPYKYSQFPKYILKRPWFLKPNSLRLYIYLLLEANYQDNYKSNNIPLLKNQLLTSSNSLEKALELTRQKVETALETLKKTGDIAIKPTPKYSIITLLFDNKQKTGEEASKEVLFIFSQLPKYIKTKNWFLKPKTLRLYIYLLSNKSYKKTLINNIPLLKDQLLTSINSLEKALKLTTKEIRTALKHLQETNDIAIKPTPKYSIITLLFEEEKEGKQKTGDEALAGFTPQEDDSKIRAKTRACFKEEDKNINIKVISESENDFQEFWGKYPKINTPKGSKEDAKKLYIKIRQGGITKKQMLDAVDGYRQMLEGTKTAKYQQSSKRVDGWLKKDYEEYLTEDCTEQLKEIEARIKAIEPEATITVENQEIIVYMLRDSFIAYSNSIDDNITPLCKAINYQLLTKSITTQNN